MLINQLFITSHSSRNAPINFNRLILFCLQTSGLYFIENENIILINTDSGIVHLQLSGKHVVPLTNTERTKGRQIFSGKSKKTKICPPFLVKGKFFALITDLDIDVTSSS